MDDHSPTFVHLHRDDSGYGSPLLNNEFSSPQQVSSTYYPYQHTYHPHLAYSNNSFHLYDQLISNNNIYNVIDSSISMPLEQPSAPAIDLCSSPQPVCTNARITPSKETVSNNTCPLYEYKINWGKRKSKYAKFILPPQGRRRRQRTVFTQSNVQQLDNIFIHNQYPDIELREALAAQMGVPESRIQVWFKNRRTRARTAHRQQLKLSESSSH